METYTFIFIEEGYASKAVVTAETRKDCEEKYFMKHPERKDSPNLEILFGDWFDDIELEMRPNGS